MKKFLWFVPRFTCTIEGEAAPSGGGASTEVADPVAAAPTTAEPTAEQVATPETTIDPNDPLAGLMGDIERLAAEDAPTGEQAAPAAPPAEFAEALSISPFVTDAAQVQQAVRAADEVWKVATGETNAAVLIEGIKAANPQRYEGIINELIPYIENVTGKKFGGEATPADPVAQLRKEIADKETAREQAAQTQQWNQSVAQAQEVASKTIAASLKGTFAEGQEQYILGQIWQAAQAKNIPQQQMLRDILSGNMKPVEALLKDVRRAEVARLKTYNENIIKQRKTLAGSVPATKNTPLTPQASGISARQPNETVAQYAVRLGKEAGFQ